MGRVCGRTWGQCPAGISTVCAAGYRPRMRSALAGRIQGSLSPLHPPARKWLDNACQDDSKNTSRANRMCLAPAPSYAEPS